MSILKVDYTCLTSGLYDFDIVKRQKNMSVTKVDFRCLTSWLYDYDVIKREKHVSMTKLNVLFISVMTRLSSPSSLSYSHAFDSSMMLINNVFYKHLVSQCYSHKSSPTWIKWAHDDLSSSWMEQLSKYHLGQKNTDNRKKSFSFGSLLLLHVLIIERIWNNSLKWGQSSCNDFFI